MTEIPSELLSLCPGCAQALTPKGNPCPHCGLGAAAVPTFWSRRELPRAQVTRNLAATGIVTVLAMAPIAIVLLVEHPRPVFIAAAVAASLAGVVCAGLLLQPVLGVVAARLRKRSWWTYATEWTGDLGHGQVEAQMALDRGRLTWARGRYRAWGQPRGRRFGTPKAPLASQRRFVRWLTAEVLAGRAHVANRRTIDWELRSTPAAPGEGIERTEEQVLMVAPSAGEQPATDALSLTIYTRHLTEPTGVAVLWFALAKDAHRLPEPELAEHEVPDWALDLEAALTAEVGPLVLN